MIFFNNTTSHKNKSFPLVHEQDQEMFQFLTNSRTYYIVAGGAALSWYQDQSVGDKDIDIWFKNQSSLDKMSKYLSAHSVRCRKTYDTEYAETWAVDLNPDKKYKVQLIKFSSFKDPHDVLDEFDITVCQIATDGDNWWVGEKFCQDVKDRRLTITKVRPQITKRLLKYWIYGFQPDDQTLKLMIDNPDTVWDYSTSTDEEYANAI